MEFVIRGGPPFGLSLAQKFGVILVDSVTPGGKAAQVGLAPGDRITAINGNTIGQSLRDAVLHLRNATHSDLSLNVVKQESPNSNSSLNYKNPPSQVNAQLNSSTKSTSSSFSLTPHQYTTTNVTHSRSPMPHLASSNSLHPNAVQLRVLSSDEASKLGLSGRWRPVSYTSRHSEKSRAVKTRHVYRAAGPRSRSTEPRSRTDSSFQAVATPVSVITRRVEDQSDSQAKRVPPNPTSQRRRSKSAEARPRTEQPSTVIDPPYFKSGNVYKTTTKRSLQTPMNTSSPSLNTSSLSSKVFDFSSSFDNIIPLNPRTNASGKKDWYKTMFKNMNPTTHQPHRPPHLEYVLVNKKQDPSIKATSPGAYKEIPIDPNYRPTCERIDEGLRKVRPKTSSPNRSLYEVTYEFDEFFKSLEEESKGRRPRTSSYSHDDVDRSTMSPSSIDFSDSGFLKPYQSERHNSDGKIKNLAYHHVQKGGEIPINGLQMPYSEKVEQQSFKDQSPTYFPLHSFHSSSQQNILSDTARSSQDLSSSKYNTLGSTNPTAVIKKIRRANSLSRLAGKRLYDDRKGSSLDRDFSISNHSVPFQDAAEVVFAFKSLHPSELDLAKGDIVNIRRKVDAFWYEGELNGKIGVFPSNYVKLLPSEAKLETYVAPVRHRSNVSENISETEHVAETTRIPPSPSASKEVTARAKYDFRAENPGELDLLRGDFVTITRKIDENWYEGTHGYKTGIFPIAFVEVLVNENLIPTHEKSTSLNNLTSLSLNDATIDTKSTSSKYDLNQLYRVKCPYQPKYSDELELQEDDVITVIEKCDDGWFVGFSNKNRQFGTFPGNFLTPL